MTWTSTMLEGLLEARASGEQDFARAWRHAERRARGLGVARPRDFISKARDEQEDEGWLPFSSFFRHACRAEWEGRVVGDFAGLREMLELPRIDEARSPYGSERTVLLA